MESRENYGLIIRLLRERAQWSVREFAKRAKRSVGWVSEVENAVGTARLSETEFDRLVDLLGGHKDRGQFRTWVANYRNAERVDRTFEGAILKFLRRKKELRLEDVAKAVGLSVAQLSKIESGRRELTGDLRNRIMAACGYSPGSFKNFSADPVRSKAVPSSYKLGILLKQLDEDQIRKIFEFGRGLKGEDAHV